MEMIISIFCSFFGFFLVSLAWALKLPTIGVCVLFVVMVIAKDFIVWTRVQTVNQWLGGGHIWAVRIGAIVGFACSAELMPIVLTFIYGTGLNKDEDQRRRRYSFNLGGVAHQLN